MSRISPDPPHRVSTQCALFDDQSCQQGLLLGRWEFAVVGFSRARNGSTPLRVAAGGSRLPDVLHVATLPDEPCSSRTDHSGRSSPFFFASAMAGRLSCTYIFCPALRQTGLPSSRSPGDRRPSSSPVESSWNPFPMCDQAGRHRQLSKGHLLGLHCRHDLGSVRGSDELAAWKHFGESLDMVRCHFG